MGEECEDFNQQTYNLFSPMFLSPMEKIPKIYLDDNADRNFDDFLSNQTQFTGQ